MEAEAGIEPAHKGFAVPCLTTWLLRHGEYIIPPETKFSSYEVKIREKNRCCSYEYGRPR